jgi:hypothetical protein
MRDDLFEVVMALCSYRQPPNICSKKGVGPLCAIGVCPVLAAAERVVERLDTPIYIGTVGDGDVGPIDSETLKRLYGTVRRSAATGTVDQEGK